MTDDEIVLWLITKATMEDKPVMRLAADRLIQVAQALREHDDLVECNEQFFVDNQFLKKRVEKAEAERDRLREALKPLVAIADAFDENELDDEARLHWTHGTNDTPHDQIELYQGRGGRRLLTMRHCMVARAALKGETP